MIVLYILGVIGALILSSFFSGVETAAYSLSSVRLRVQADQGSTRARLGVRMIQRLTEIINTTLVGNNITIYLATYFLTLSVTPLAQDAAEIAATLILTPVCFLLSESLPKRVAHAMPNDLFLNGIRVLYAARCIFWPLTKSLGLISNGLRLLLTHFGLSTQELNARARLFENLEAGAAEGVLTQEQHQIATRIMEVDDMTLAEVMLPESGVLRVREDEPALDAAKTILNARRARAFLCDRSGRLTGRMVTVNQIMRTPGSLDHPVVHCSQPAMLLDAKTPALRALTRMRNDRARLALVIGRGGAPIGSISISRLLSRIVGRVRL